MICSSEKIRRRLKMRKGYDLDLHALIYSYIEFQSLLDIQMMYE
jgi:hypothetical protein